MSYFFFLYWSPYSPLGTVSDSISSNIHQVLSIRPSAVFVFGDFKVHHKDWLTYSGRADRSRELCSNFLSQMTLLWWLTFLLESQAVILIVLFFWIYLFLLTLVFVLQWLSLHWKIISCCCLSLHRTSIKFITGCPVSSHSLWLFLWEALRNHLRDALWKDILKLSPSAAPSQFCEWVHVGIDVYIPHYKYQVIPHSSPWFSAAWEAAIVHRNHFFRFYQQNKAKSRKASNHCNGVLEAAKLAYANKTRVHHFPEIWLSVPSANCK